MDILSSPDFLSQVSAFFSVVFIDLVMAGDNAVAVGLAAAGLAAHDRKKAILYGLIAAVIMRIGFVLITAQLLSVVGLLFAGGLLLLWVAWKMWRELHEQEAEARAKANLEDATGADINGESMGGAAATPAKTKSFKTAVIQILIADLSMSLDNVLAVAGASRQHPEIMVFGLILAIALMGVASHFIAKVLHKFRWIGFVGLAVILYVACNMIWEGHRDVVVDLKKVDEYNQVVPDFMDITQKDIDHFTHGGKAAH
ncbi:YjbE family putative metal transport protein [Asticcacaulis sp. BYS171W]|uniref:YjbE family putative metal transport protein n=1 Tax=Asticcacaulis aquaticus TaxID=2984212 RepID=A0ABT5HPI5_9CAUL|nr:YjbE family putative metal transport protein [Asticcacaulis aquaticus]MDC7681977.1 YjbE family putative metal transport protein [Asticcacaulis aquaticus]